MAARRVVALAKRRGVEPAEVAFIALDPAGRTGAACTRGTDFYFAVGRDGKVEVTAAREVE
jgi:hypothetical protein